MNEATAAEIRAWARRELLTATVITSNTAAYNHIAAALARLDDAVPKASPAQPGRAGKQE